jgi:hypothetical protein
MIPVFRNKRLLLIVHVLYSTHYFLKKEAFYPKPLKYYLGDLLCMPIVLSMSLIIMSIIYFKKYARLSLVQIGLSTILFSLYFELLLPTISKSYVQDPLDVICYISGGLIYGLLFNPKQITNRNSSLA